MLRFFEVDTTRKQLKIHFVGFSRHEYDEWRDYDNKRNYFPFVRLEKKKMFFPEEGSLEDRGNIFLRAIVWLHQEKVVVRQKR